MAGRSYGIGSTGTTVTAATLARATLVALLACGPAAAQQLWDGEPTTSVMVESGVPAGGIMFGADEGSAFITDGANGDGVAAISDDASAVFAGGDACAACNGAGCNECRKTAIVDLLGHCHDKNATWIGRADALILWRNAPPDRRIISGGFLNANDMDSPAAAGPRFSIFRVNNCTGGAIEATYLRAANFRSVRPYGVNDAPYALAGSGIYGNTGTFDTANADLGARLQSFELNHHHCITRNVRFLTGFRWIEWQEQFSMETVTLGGATDFYQTNCFNDLYGGQIGLDANLLATRWIRVDSLVKAGVYYNTAVQSSQYSTTDVANPGSASVTVGEQPLSGAFAGEVGITGVIPLTCCIDFRFGYFGLWLSGIAQPTQQLSGQDLAVGEPEVGTLNANGGVLLQGVSVGLEGRW